MTLSAYDSVEKSPAHTSANPDLSRGLWLQPLAPIAEPFHRPATPSQYVPPKMARLAKQDVPSLSFTYNEPLVGYEWVTDARFAKDGIGDPGHQRLCEEPLAQLLPYGYEQT